jgi:hypothetical protein
VGHRLEERWGVLADRLTRHATGHTHQDVHRELAVAVDQGVGVDLQVHP